MLVGMTGNLSSAATAGRGAVPALESGSRRADTTIGGVSIRAPRPRRQGSLYSRRVRVTPFSAIFFTFQNRRIQATSMKSTLNTDGTRVVSSSGMLAVVASLVTVMVAGTASAQTGAGQAGQPPDAGVFRSGVDLVTVSATVRDRRGRAVADLAASDFQVFDRGVERPIAEFRTEAAPVSVAILFDVSGSMDLASRALAARFAAHHVLSWLEHGRDEAALFAFDSRLHEVAPFTVDTRALQGALGEVDPFGATSLHDAIADTARRISERANRRRAIIVLTDGIDTASRLTPADVSGIASEIDVPVYVVAVVLPIDNPDANGRPSLEEQVPLTVGTIRELAAWTGGELFYASTPSDTSKVARQIVRELRQQYLIAFEPSTGAGWHPIEIRTTKKNLTVRARGGYVAGGARSDEF
ncbi:MAG: VWA domain-containing protein [Vicinamibacterales bacterium]